MKKEFKVNDWCFCEFELQQIKEMEEGRVTSVTTGQFCLSGNDLTDRCFPISMPVKLASDTSEYWHTEFNKLSMNSLNYPDLHRKLVAAWVDMCEETNTDKLKILYKNIDTFGIAVLNKVRDMRYEMVEDVNLFRR